MPYPAGRVPGDHYSLHSVGGSRVYIRRHRFHRTLVAVFVAVLAAPASAAVATPPAVDQYTEHLPGAGGAGPAGGETPVARPGLLSSKTLAALSGPDGQLLAEIATARDLGAPAHARSGGPGIGTSGDGRGFATAAAATAGTLPGLALFGALGVIALAGGWTWFIRRGRSPADLD
jgi:hypothetical protein